MWRNVECDETLVGSAIFRSIFHNERDIERQEFGTFGVSILSRFSFILDLFKLTAISAIHWEAARIGHGFMLCLQLRKQQQKEGMQRRGILSHPIRSWGSDDAGTDRKLIWYILLPIHWFIYSFFFCLVEVYAA